MIRIITITILSLVVISSAMAASPSFDNMPMASGPIRFAIIGDRTSEAAPGVYEEIVAEVEQMHPDFVMTVGDAIQGYTDDTLKLDTEWDELFSIIKPLAMPIYLTPGNHDITSNVAQGTYQRRVGKPYYSFDVRNFHFIVLDVTRWEKSENLPADELAWLIKDLDDHKSAAQTLVFYHKPYWYNSITMGKPDTLHEIFVKGGVDAVFNGHLHTYFSTRIDGIKYTAVGSSGGIIDAMPTDLNYHFTWVTVSDSGIEIAPIKKGSVKPWDQVTAAEAHTADNIVQFGTKFTVKAPVSDDMRITDGTAVLELNNITSNTLSDTIRWNALPGWIIEPSEKYVTVNPGEKKQVSFNVTSTGALYPVPKVTVGFPYAAGKSIPITKELRVARVAIALPADKAPVIDGTLEEPIWHSSANRLYDDDGSTAKTESTWFYLAYDHDNLYLAAHCGESKIKSLKSDAATRDGRIGGDDYVSFYLQPDPQVDTAYQIMINPAGTISDYKLYRGVLSYFSNDKSWNGDFVVKTKKGKDYWNIEARIPLSQLKAAAGQSGQNWGVNFVRSQKRLNADANWQIPVDYDPQTFGVLEFK